ncbi:MAG TPA: pyridoxamine 5'-phosphate oxidase family protein [Acidimicrobiia bacterium]|nr:pyridoxamine 5'-phosphate oxidase family protein [Acidimicrobiia bacterium]
MATWQEVETAVPDLAAAVRAVLDAHKHKVLATLRADGSPRVSGNELTFKDGEVWMGMMDRSVKALDLLRDPRLAVHSATVDAELTKGDAKLSGRAVEETDPETIRRFGSDSAEEHDGAEAPEAFHLFRVDVGEVSLVRIGDPADHLVIEFWSPAAGYRRTERR